MKRPAFFLALFFLAGWMVGKSVPLRPDAAGLLALAAGLSALGVFIRSGRRQGGAYDSGTGFRILLAAIFVLGLVQQNALEHRDRRAEQQVKRLSGTGEVLLRGTVADEPRRRGDRVTLLLRSVDVWSGDSADPERLAARVQVAFQDRSETALPYRGERIELRGELRDLPQPSHRDLLDYGMYLRSHGVAAQVWLKSGQEARRVFEEDRRVERWLFSFLMQWRRSTLDLLGQLRVERAAVVRAMLLGEVTGLSGTRRAEFARIGGNHLFSVSGLHTGFVALLVFALCRLLQVPLRMSSATTILMLVIYCGLVGFRPPVVRASIIYGCLLLPYLAGRAVDRLNALSVAALFTMLLNPRAPMRVDFQFSYLCMLGLITLTPALCELLCFDLDRAGRGRRQWAALYNHWLGMPLAIVMAAQLAILPPLAYYYQQFSLIGFVANLVMVPLACVIFIAGCAFSVLGPIWPASLELLSAICSMLAGLFLWLARVLASVHGAAVHLPPLAWWLIAFYYLLLFSGAHMFMRMAPGQREVRRSRLLLRLAGVGALLAWWPLLAIHSGRPDNLRPPGDFLVTMIDVGQGDSFLLEFPDGKAMMIDAGPPFSASRIRQLLGAKGIAGLNALLLTHADSDHIGGAPEVIDTLRVERLFVGPSRSGSLTHERLDAAIRRRGVSMEEVASGDMLRGARGVGLTVLGPSEHLPASAGANSRAVVLMAEYGAIRFLFTGDADSRAENAMLREWGEDALAADVLKVGHHGSASSTGEAFLDAVMPFIGLLSVAERNAYGHPHPDVLARLERIGCLVYSTAEHGVVELSSNGERLWIRVGKP